jgi:hypothetical protein
MTKGLSIHSLDARKAGETPFEFEYVQEGEPTGVWLSVLGSHCDKVDAAINAAVDARNKNAAVIQARNAKARPDSAEVEPLENAKKFTQRLAAVRLVGWRGAGQTEGLTPEEKARFQGITEPYSPELAVTLCQINPPLADAVIEEANRLSNFMKLSPAT